MSFLEETQELRRAQLRPKLIVLDTNAIQADRFLRKAGAEALLDYVSRTGSRVLVPRIVLQELEANYRRLLLSRVAAIDSAANNLRRVLAFREFSAFDIDVEAEVLEYLALVRGRLQVSANGALEYELRDVQDAVERAIARRRPCSDKGEEIRDAIIWACVVRLLSKDIDVVFITGDSGAFRSKGILHEELQKEVAAQPGAFYLHDSLDDFAKQHASAIQFVTKDWVLSNVEIKDLLVTASAAIIDQVKASILRNSHLAESEIYDFEVTSGDFDPEDLSVYVMKNGDLRIFIDWVGGAEVAYRVFRSHRDYLDFGYDFAKGRYDQGDPAYQPDQQQTFRWIDAWVSLSMTMSVVGQEAKNWILDSVRAELLERRIG